MDEATYSQALEIARQEPKVSTAFFQRKMNLGWSKAQAIVERMLREGVIRPALVPGAPYPVNPAPQA